MLVIGHRGARGEAPENTLASFSHARAAGVRHFELDVRLSGDGKAVVVHDDLTDRTTGFSGAIASLTAAELGALDARRGTPGWHEPVGIPLLEDVLKNSIDTDSWQLEIKGDTPDRIRALAHVMCTIIDSLGLREKITLTSLDVPSLRIVKDALPALRHAYVAEYPDPPPLATALEFNASLMICNWRLVDESLVTNAHAAGLPVSVWTVNDLPVADRMLALGVDSIITDYPTAMLAHLAMRERLSGQQR
jgi:glycerophosphoryl diester phosphodiesterase